STLRRRVPPRSGWHRAAGGGCLSGVPVAAALGRGSPGGHPAGAAARVVCLDLVSHPAWVSHTEQLSVLESHWADDAITGVFRQSLGTREKGAAVWTKVGGCGSPCCWLPACSWCPARG